VFFSIRIHRILIKVKIIQNFVRFPIFDKMQNHLSLEEKQPDDLLIQQEREEELSPDTKEFRRQFSLFRRSKSRSMVFDDPNSDEVNGMTTNITFQEMPAYRADFGLHREISHHTTMNAEKGNHVEIQINREHLVSGDPFVQEHSQAAKSILHLLTLRDKYLTEHSQCKK